MGKRIIGVLVLTAGLLLGFQTASAHAWWYGDTSTSQPNQSGGTVFSILYYKGYDSGARSVYSTSRYNTGLANYVCVWDTSGGGAGVCQPVARYGWHNSTLGYGITSTDSYVYTSVCRSSVAPENCSSRQKVYLSR